VSLYERLLEMKAHLGDDGLYHYCSGLESAASGTHCQALGPQTRYQQCQIYDNFELLFGAYGHSFLTM
jgi:Fe-S-cluster containining protein